jgi:NAD(P)H-dependent flavin oxidoreductase YrpB (nitropropane dioxygenase family)
MARMLRTSFTDLLAIDVPVVGAPMADVSGGRLAAADGPREELSAARKRGDYDIAHQYAGQGVGLVREERPAAEVVAGLAAGAERLLRGWG